jgi:hypothetical protein
MTITSLAATLQVRDNDRVSEPYTPRDDDPNGPRWLHGPAEPVQLVSPAMLLQLLVIAVAATREPGSLVLPGGVAVTPGAPAESPYRS